MRFRFVVVLRALVFGSLASGALLLTSRANTPATAHAQAPASTAPTLRAAGADVVAAPAPAETFAATYERFAVAADHPAASAAGAEILAAGGNAADAAAATMLALGVASPASSGLGGGGFLLYYRASDRTFTFLDFREAAPAAATPEMFVDRPAPMPGRANAASQVGGLASGVPGEPAGIEAMVRRFGSGLPLSRIVANERPQHVWFSCGSQISVVTPRPSSRRVHSRPATRPARRSSRARVPRRTPSSEVGSPRGTR